MIVRGLESAGINEKLSFYPFLLCWISTASDHSRAMQNPDLTLDVKARTSAFSSSTENTEKSINNKQLQCVLPERKRSCRTLKQQGRFWPSRNEIFFFLCTAVFTYRDFWKWTNQSTSSEEVHLIRPKGIHVPLCTRNFLFVFAFEFF